jgi:hypothetical protein
MRTRYRKILVAAALTTLALTAIVASAANAATPAPPYQDFAGCPSEAENELVGSCFKYVFDGGHLKLGGVEVAVSNPIVVRGGAESVTGNFVGNGEAGIVPTQEKVTGGLGKLLGVPWLVEGLAPTLLKVNATVELAGTPGSITNFPFTLPVKLHLQNPLLGSSCYIGSASSPIALSLGTGTTSPPAPNKPITGQSPTPFHPEAEREEVRIAENGILVDNAFAVPATTGCNGLADYINSAGHLPAAAGNSEAVLNYDLSLAFPSVVYPEG